MPELARVSVVVPCLNRRAFIGPTIESILGQDYPSVECIAVDGGSTDGTLEALEEYGASISVVCEAARGPAAAINRGLELSSGAYVAWLNADDVWLPNAVSAAVRRFESGDGADVVYGGCGGIDLQGRQLWTRSAAPWSLADAVLKCDTVIYQPAAFMRRAMFDDAGGLNTDWCHDHDLWIRIALAGGRFETVDSTLANCRIWAGDHHNDPALMVPALLRLIDRTFADPRLPSEWRGLQRQARSFVYARCLEYLVVTRPAHWLLALSFLGKAISMDPSGTPRIAAHAVSLLPIAARRLVELVEVRSRPSTPWAVTRPCGDFA
jgi:glycosyltransferase involved in cell wall biosynthesis